MFGDAKKSWLMRLYQSIYPIEQVALQDTLEQTLCTFCDGMQPGEMGMHWAFDWLFARKEAFALAIGRFFEPTSSHCYIALRHQSNLTGTVGHGVVYELRLPIDALKFDASAGVLKMSYQGRAFCRVLRLCPETESPGDGVTLPDGEVKIEL